MPTPDDRAEVFHLSDESRFVVRQHGAEAELVYRVHGDHMTLVHTGVPDELGGRGLGGLLVGAALDYAMARGLTVSPWCPFARDYLVKHPEAAAGVRLDWHRPPAKAGSVENDPGDGRLEEIEENGLDEQERESFPASDPHSDWAGPTA